MDNNTEKAKNNAPESRPDSDDKVTTLQTPAPAAPENDGPKTDDPKESKKDKKKKRKEKNGDSPKKAGCLLILTLFVVLIVVGAVAYIGFMCLDKPADIIEGQVEGETVRVSGKLAGRVEAIYVHAGDTVHAGDRLVHIKSTIVDAQLNQAEAMEEVAKAQDRKVDAGTRIEIINTARDLVTQADAAVSITQKTYERLENLFNEGVVTEQKRDEAKAAYDAAIAQKAAAQSQYELALAGAQKEDKESAAAMVKASKASVNQVQSLLEDSYLVAPCDGIVDQIFPAVGELVALGAPIMNILKPDRHIVFNVKEELLPDFDMNTEFVVFLPAMRGKEIPIKVFYIRDMGNYATWRATKNIGDYDSRTFEIKARPVDNNDAEGLRPGMSAIRKQDIDSAAIAKKHPWEFWKD